MPPKPFNPPRPRASTSGAKKPPGRPKGSTSASTSNTKTNGVTKPKPKRKSAEKKDTPRVSAASRLSFGGLPSLSPDSDDEVAAQDDEDDVEEDGEDEELLPPAHKRTSGATAKAKSRASMNGNEGGEIQKADPLDGRKEGIPEDLLNVLMHQHFKESGKKGTRLTLGANKAVGRYMETFVREAIARAAYSRTEGIGKSGGALEVEDLEKMAPQLLLDF